MFLTVARIECGIRGVLTSLALGGGLDGAEQQESHTTHSTSTLHDYYDSMQGQLLAVLAHFKQHLNNHRSTLTVAGMEADYRTLAGHITEWMLGQFPALRNRGERKTLDDIFQCSASSH